MPFQQHLACYYQNLNTAPIVFLHRLNSFAKPLHSAIAQEYAPNKIRINSIAPGAIKTPINNEAWETHEAEKKLLKLIPYGRVGVVEDIGKAAVWLASDDSDYVVGTTLFVDGGMTLYPAFADNG